MIPLTQLIEINEKNLNHENILKDNLFDSVLYNQNKVFRNIRNRTCELGYNFNQKPDGLWMQYRAFPLLSLTSIFKHKTIPYSNNVSYLKDIVNNGINFEVDLAFLTTAMVRNPLFHESGHCIADSLLFNTNLVATDEDKSVRYLIAEAFGFCIFQFCGLEAKSKESIIGCVINDIAILTPELNAFKAAIHCFGSENAMIIYMISHIFCMSQIPFDKVDKSLLKSYMDIEFKPEHEVVLHKILEIGYSILPSFATTIQDIFYNFVNLPRPNPEMVLSLFNDANFKFMLLNTVSELETITLQG